MNKKGFSLIEITVVLALIGLLVGALSIGSDLIKDSKRTKLISDFSRHKEYYEKFRAKYSVPPGDLSTAFTLWNTNCGADAAACNGDGDGIIESNTPNSNLQKEPYNFWRHLYLAGFTQFNPVSTTVVADNRPGKHYFEQDEGIGMYALQNIFGFGSRNVIYVGKRDQTTTFAAPLGLTHKPEDVWSIERKIDDGVPTTGNIRASSTNGVSAGSCYSGTSYLVTETTERCMIGYLLD